MFNRYPKDVPDQEKINIFIDNLTSEMSYSLKIQCPPFSKMLKNSLKIEDAMVKKGELKLHNSSYNNNNNNNCNNNNDKPKFWLENRNVTNEGIYDRNATKQQPIFNLSSQPPKNKMKRTIDLILSSPILAGNS